MILLTGATGFVGRQVLREISSRSLECKVICTDPNKIDIEYKNSIKEIFQTENLFLENTTWWDNALKDIDIIIHLAWYVKHGEYINSEKNIECLEGSLNLAQSCINNNIKKFVGIGTCFEYDLSGSDIDINTPLNPLNLYSASKVSLFHTLQNLFKKNKMDFLWCRLFYLYGDGESENRFYPYLKNKMLKNEIADLSDGLQIRDFLDVKIVGKIILDASLAKNTGPFNVCSGDAISIREFAYRIADQYGSRKLLNFGARADNAFDPKYVVGIPTKIKN